MRCWLCGMNNDDVAPSARRCTSKMQFFPHFLCSAFLCDIFKMHFWCCSQHNLFWIFVHFHYFYWNYLNPNFDFWPRRETCESNAFGSREKDVKLELCCENANLSAASSEHVRTIGSSIIEIPNCDIDRNDRPKCNWNIVLIHPELHEIVDRMR